MSEVDTALQYRSEMISRAVFGSYEEVRFFTEKLAALSPDPREGQSKEGVRRTTFAFVSTILRSDVYSISNGIHDVLLAGSKDLVSASPPKLVTVDEELLPTPSGLAVFPKPVELIRVEKEGKDVATFAQAVGWCSYHDPGTVRNADGSWSFSKPDDRRVPCVAIFVFGFAEIDGRRTCPIPFTASTYPLGIAYNPAEMTIEEIEDELSEFGVEMVEKGSRKATSEPVAYLLALWSFCGQELVDFSRRDAPRAWRRRDRPELPISAVRRIVLRKKVRDGGTGEERDVEWSCRWLVSGHFRNQFYPSTGKHRLIWIAPYVKGPDGLPLRAPAERVFEVRR